MGLRTKFNLVMLTTFLIGLAAAALLGRQVTGEIARAQVLHEASGIMQQALAVRAYTAKEIVPLLKDQLSTRFLPHTVPSWSAQTVLRGIHRDVPAYSYKEAALNPTNPADRASDWEADIINEFRLNSGSKEIVRTRDTPEGEVLTLAHPLQINDKACLTCHSVPANAPASMIDLYGSNGGFGWNVGETIGAQLVSVPVSIAEEQAGRLLRTFLEALAGIFLLMMLVVNLLLHWFIVRPVHRISALAESVSAGDLNVEEYQPSGKDEIASLARSFNLMRRSLDNAMRMLEQHTLSFRPPRR